MANFDVNKEFEGLYQLYKRAVIPELISLGFKELKTSSEHDFYSYRKATTWEISFMRELYKGAFLYVLAYSSKLSSTVFEFEITIDTTEGFGAREIVDPFRKRIFVQNQSGVKKVKVSIAQAIKRATSIIEKYSKESKIMAVTIIGAKQLVELYGRNIANIKDLETKLNKRIIPLARENQQIENWISKNLKNWLLRESDSVVPVRKAKSAHPKWVPDLLNKNEEVLEVKLTPELTNKIAHMLDYLHTRVDEGSNIKLMSVPDAFRLTEQWDEQLKKAKIKEGEGGEVKVVRSYPGDYHWVQLLDEEAFRFEGNSLGHCIGRAGYFEEYKKGRSLFFSLRGPKNKPLVTVTYNIASRVIADIKGWSNGKIKDEGAKKFIVDFVNKPVKGIGPFTEIHDLHLHKLTSIGNFVYDPKGNEKLVVPENLDISNGFKDEFPETLEIKGDFFLKGSLPKLDSLVNLTVGGNFTLVGPNNLKTWPETWKVGKSINLSKVKIGSLPKNFKVNGDFNLSYSNIASLPPGLTISGTLDVSHTPIRKIPKDLSCKEIVLDVEQAEDIGSLPMKVTLSKGVVTTGKLKPIIKDVAQTVQTQVIDKVFPGALLVGPTSKTEKTYHSSLFKVLASSEVRTDAEQVKKKVKTAAETMMVKNKLAEKYPNVRIKIRVSYPFLVLEIEVHNFNAKLNTNLVVI